MARIDCFKVQVGNKIYIQGNHNYIVDEAYRLFPKFVNGDERWKALIDKLLINNRRWIDINTNITWDDLMNNFI